MSCSNQKTRFLNKLYKNTVLVSCYYCENLLLRAEATIDHKIPRARGGSRKRSNLVLACKDCNYEKGDLPFEFFIYATKDDIKKYNKLVKENNKEYWINRVFLEGRPS